MVLKIKLQSIFLEYFDFFSMMIKFMLWLKRECVKPIILFGDPHLNIFMFFLFLLPCS